MPIYAYSLQGRNEGRKGVQFPGRRITIGAPNHRWSAELLRGRRQVPTMPQVFSLIQQGKCGTNGTLTNLYLGKQHLPVITIFLILTLQNRHLG